MAEKRPRRGIVLGRLREELILRYVVVVRNALTAARCIWAADEVEETRRMLVGRRASDCDVPDVKKRPRLLLLLEPGRGGAYGDKESVCRRQGGWMVEDVDRE